MAGTDLSTLASGSIIRWDQPKDQIPAGWAIHSAKLGSLWLVKL